MSERASMIGRMFLIFGVIMLLPCAIVLQIMRIQFFEGENLRELWNRQAVDFISIPAQRGDILDAKGRLLVTNSVRHRLALDPHVKEITQEQINLLLQTLGNITGRGTAYYRQILSNAPGSSRYVVLERSLDHNEYETIQALDIRGVILEESYRRKYNYDSLAGHTLGFVNNDLKGMIGMEASFDNLLKGTEGIQQVRRDRSNRIRAIVGSPRKNPKQGHTLQTTIDAQIQAIVEEELEKGIENTRSKYGTAIVMDPKTGAIKAMANYPTYNPNSPGSSEGENRRNYAISDMIEPGSTFKLVTSIAAIEQDIIEEGEIFETPASGQQQIHGQWMRDHNPLGDMTYDETIIKSSNIATSEVAMRLEPEVLYQYARNLGFGSSTNVGLPNEETGRLRRPFNWSSVSLPWISIGYEVQVTPLQMVQAYAAFANDGVLMQPYILQKVIDENGRIRSEHSPKAVRRVIKPETIERLMPVFEAVVADSGTASYAQVEGLSIAGKTGTAQKYINGQYRSRYRASFVGLYPTDDPSYVCLILLDEPKTSYYGGYTAGPIFREITKRIIGLDDELQLAPTSPKPVEENYLAHAPSLKGLTFKEAVKLLKSAGLSYTTEGNGLFISDQFPVAGETFEKREGMHLSLSEKKSIEKKLISEDHNIIPDVHGLSMRKALHLLNQAGYDIRIIGSGTIKAQFPEAGAQYVRGRTVTIRGNTRAVSTLISQTLPLN
ncbi:MAG: penicillin-binding transpeptidase domain-containing protein [Balneolales bacterium]